MHCREPSCALSGCGPASRRVVGATALASWRPVVCDAVASKTNLLIRIHTLISVKHPRQVTRGRRRILQKKVTDEQTASCGVVLVRKARASPSRIPVVAIVMKTAAYLSVFQMASSSSWPAGNIRRSSSRANTSRTRPPFPIGSTWFRGFRRISPSLSASTRILRTA
jgi:hypothetical protein